MTLAIEQIKTQFGGAENVGKSAILPDVKEIKTYERDFQKLQFIDMRKFARGNVCAALGVPEFLLGFTESVNNNNGVELRKNFYENTAQVWEVRLAQYITRGVLFNMGVDTRFVLEFNSQIFNTNNPLEEYKSGTITLKEYRLATGKDVTPEDEKRENFDEFIIHSGGSARLLGDVGVEPVADIPQDQKEAQNLVRALDGNE
jgi:phage portal protein BeeE